MIISNVREIQIPEGNVRCILRGYETLWDRYLLPNGYQEVSYIQSNGNCYFRTGVVPTDKTRMEMQIYTTCTDSFYASGSRSAGGTIYFGQTGTRTNSRVSGSVNESSVQASTDGTLWTRTSSGQMYDIMLQTNGDGTYDYTIDDTTHDKSYEAIGQTYTAMGDVSDNYDICIFALSGSYIIGGINRLYTYRLYQDDNLVRDFVPCYRLSDGVVGLYDIVTRSFFQNAGTGTLTKGEILLPRDYQEVEYIESTGTQYIDTGIALNNGCVITLDFLIAEASTNRTIYGWRRKGRYTEPYQAMVGANASKTRYIAVGRSSTNVPQCFKYDVRNKVLIDSANEQVLVNNLVVDCGADFSNRKAFDENGSSVVHPYLFALNNAGTPLAISKDSRIYAYSVQYGDELLQSFVPCYRKSDGEIGMYDIVTRTFYTNAGTGAFAKGADV